ncbi:MAG: hypothetical protein N2Z72_02395 [Bacteroidales bacterium]|nr:hypothetical protein [Bacteroidales bacterium]
MLKKINIFLGVLILFVASCAPAYVRKGKKAIKQEVSRLQETHTYFRKLDTTQVRDVFKSYMASLDSLKKYFKEKENEEQWYIMTQWGQVKKALQVYLSSYPAIEKDFRFSYKQLSNLQHDLRYKLVSAEAFKQYLNDEIEANNNLIIRARMLVDNAEMSLKIYHQFQFKIDSLIQVMRNQSR